MKTEFFKYLYWRYLPVGYLFAISGLDGIQDSFQLAYDIKNQIQQNGGSHNFLDSAI